MNAKMFEYLDEMEKIYRTSETTKNAFGIKLVDNQKVSRINDLERWYHDEAEKLDNKSLAYAIKIKKEMKKAVFS